MGQFQDCVKAHMEKYNGQNNELEGKKGGEGYLHVLDLMPVMKYNFLPQYRDELVKYVKDKEIKLHSDAHHLNSSQMMCLNFFYPLICKGLLYLLLQSIDNSIDWGTPKLERTQPEYISELEKVDN